MQSNFYYLKAWGRLPSQRIEAENQTPQTSSAVKNRKGYPLRNRLRGPGDRRNGYSACFTESGIDP